MKFLIVEDEEILSKALTRFFQSQGWESKTVSSGEEAVEAITLFRPDVVLLDIYLPGKSGFDVLAECHRKFPGTIFVTMTGSPKAEDYAQSTSLGAVTCLKKPFRIEYLKNVMDLAGKIHVINDAKRETGLNRISPRLNRFLKKVRSRILRIRDLPYWIILVILSILLALSICFWPLYKFESRQVEPKPVEVNVDEQLSRFSAGLNKYADSSEPAYSSHIDE